MKKILFITPELGHGGTNRCLLNLLGVTDSDKYQIDIFAMRHEGPYEKLLQGYSLLPEQPLLSVYYSYPKAIAGENLWGKIKKTALKFYLKFGLKNNQRKVYEAAAGTFSKAGYDVVVGFQESAATEFASLIAAKHHVSWVHCDYRRHIDKVKRDETEIYSRIDDVVAVSEFTAEVFRQAVPAAAGKTHAIHNLMDSQGILKRSRETVSDSRFEVSPFTLVSVGRMDPVKRFSEIPAMAAYLKAQNIPFRWYIIGDGGEEKQAVETAIRENRVEDRVILLGEKDNPYPYMAKASAVVCPSWSEACPNVVNEGLILHVPVVTADFPTATEFITTGVNGMISPIETMGETLETLWKDRDLYGRICRNLRDFTYDNRSIQQAVESILDGE